MTTIATLFLAGVLTILLPCILPLVPIVLGVSLAGRRKLRPLVTVAGMAASFVAFTFVLQVLLARLVHLADVVRVGSYYALYLFGVVFLSTRRPWQLGLAAVGAVPFFAREGVPAVVVAAFAGTAAVALGGRVALKLQQLGANVQQGTARELGRESLLSAFVVGLTLGLVWVPCAGPALGFALALVRDQPGLRALGALGAYAIGAATPLLLIGYGGQRVVGRARRLTAWSGRIKQASGAVLILSAVAFQVQLFSLVGGWLANRTGFGDFASALESRLFGRAMAAPARPAATAAADRATALPTLPRLGPAPELSGLGPWYNSPPLSLAALKGKVVLVDFWTYSCINCVRTLPELRGYWTAYGKQPFVLIGVHAPEFVFEKDPGNVADAVARHHLDYPVAQDNDLATWRAFHNQYWPAKYLIDAQGIIRYTHFGEGGGEATDKAIRSLLAEAGAHPRPTAAAGAAMPTADHPVSPETYVGPRGWEAFSNRAGPPDGRRHHYDAPASLAEDRFALVGDWQLLGGERQVLRSRVGEIRYHALGGEVNLVLGLEPGSQPVVADVIVDGKPSRAVTVDRHDLYRLYSGPYGEHEVELRVHGPNVAAYAFTFGG